MAILVVGALGQVGTELCRLGGDAIVPVDRDELDIADSAAVAAMVRDGGFEAVINAAAYTAVDRAEREVALAWAINALGPAALAEATAHAGIPLVHISTDYVFDGAKLEPYVEDDPIAPLGVYGASKEGGEQAVRTGNPRHVILRTAWVVSPHGGNFVKTMLRLAAERDVVRVVDDQRGCPTGAADVAETCLAIARRLVADLDAPTGTCHFVNAGEASWCEFARAIFAGWAERGYKVPQVEGIATADYPTPARRPVSSRLSTARIERDFGIVPRPWEAMLRDLLDTLARDAGRPATASPSA